MISACIGFKDRDERLLTATIDSLLAEGVDEIMLCNFGAQPLKIERPRLYHIHIPLDRWRLGLAFNICAVHAAGDTLLLLNGGIVLSKGALAASLPLVIPGEQYASPLTHYFRCSEGTTARYLNDQSDNLAFGAKQYDDDFAGDGDFVLIDRSDYLRIGGHDSEMEGWGRENRCFHARAGKIGFKRVRGAGNLFHLYDGFPIGQQHTKGYQTNCDLLKSKESWWRNDKR